MIDMNRVKLFLNAIDNGPELSVLSESDGAIQCEPSTGVGIDIVRDADY